MYCTSSSMVFCRAIQRLIQEKVRVRPSFKKSFLSDLNNSGGMY